MKGWRTAAAALLVVSLLSGCFTRSTPAAQGYGADLVITETADHRSVAVGGRIMLTITVTNRGPNSASEIVFGSPEPVALEYVSFWCGAGSVTSRSFCEVDHLPGGESTVAQIIATPIGNPTGSELRLNSRALITEYIARDPDKTNNSASLTITILPETLGAVK